MQKLEKFRPRNVGVFPSVGLSQPKKGSGITRKASPSFWHRDDDPVTLLLHSSRLLLRKIRKESTAVGFAVGLNQAVFCVDGFE